MNLKNGVKGKQSQSPEVSESRKYCQAERGIREFSQEIKKGALTRESKSSLLLQTPAVCSSRMFEYRCQKNEGRHVAAGRVKSLWSKNAALDFTGFYHKGRREIFHGIKAVGGLRAAVRL